MMPQTLGRLFLWAMGPFLVAWVLYYPTLEYDYVNWDDPGYVSGNFNVLMGITQENLLWGLTTGEQANWHPLTWWSLQLDSSLLGPKPASYHFTNTLLHAIVSGLFFIIAARLLKDVRLALVAAMVWSVHPLHVESVAWISERKDVLSALFWLLATWSYLVYVEKPSLFRMAGVTCLLGLGLMSKPMLVTFPFTLLLFDFAPLNRLGSRREIVRAIFEKIPLFVLVIISSAVTLHVQAKGGSVSVLSERSLFQRCEGAAVGYGFYIKKTLFPTHLIPIYEHPRDRCYWEMALSLFTLAGLTWAAYRVRKTAPLVLVGWLFFLGTLVPVIGLLQVGRQAYADRYSYIPHFGLFLALASGIAFFFDTWKLDRKGIVVGGIVLSLVTGLFAREQCSCWIDSQTLWTRAVDSSPESAEVHNKLVGLALETGDIGKAREHVEKAIALNPEVPAFFVSRAQICFLQGQYAEAEGNVAHARGFATIGSKDRSSLDYIESLIATQQNRHQDAILLLQRAIQRNPHSFLIQKTLGFQLLQRGQRDEARNAFRDALIEYPGSIDIACRFAVLSMEVDLPNEAIASLRTAIHIHDFQTNIYVNSQTSPQNTHTSQQLKAEAHAILAECLLAAGQTADALTQAREAVKCNAHVLDLWAQNAWKIATHPDGAQRDSKRPQYMIQLAQLIAAPSRPAELLDIQAAVYANQGNFAEAIRLAEEAYGTAAPVHKKGIEERLTLYKSGKPFRMPSLGNKP